MARITLYQDEVVTIDANSENTSEDALMNAKRIIEKMLGEIQEEKKKKNYPIWEELKRIKGCYINSDSSIRGRGTWPTITDNQNIFIDEQHARSALAMAKISQLMPYYGGRITSEEWNNLTTPKYAVVRGSDGLVKYEAYSLYEFIAFKTKEDRDRFLFSKENIQLLNDYFMIA